MRIDEIKLQRLNMPLKAPFQTSFGETNLKDFILVSAYGEDKVGHAETVAMTEPLYNEETTDTVWQIMEQFLIPLVLGKNINHPDEITDFFAHIRRNYMAKAGIEGAIWDLYAKHKNQTLAEALGGKKEKIDVGVSIGIEAETDALLEKVDGFLADGYKKIKVKIKPGKDIEPMKAIRERFGDRVPLMADANSAYTLEDIDIFKELDKLGLMMIEQPLANDDIVDHRKLQQEINTPICLDESIHSVEDARKAIELGSCKIINIKIGRVGGLTIAKHIHDLCEKEGIPVWCGGMLESGIGRAHNIALTTLSNFTIPGDTSASNRYWAQDIVQPAVELSEPGVLDVPSGAGIGYDLDEEALAKFVINKQSFKS